MNACGAPLYVITSQSTCAAPRAVRNGHDLRMSFPTRLLAEDETLVLVLRRHVKALFVPFLVLLLVVAALVGVAFVPAGGLSPHIAHMMYLCTTCSQWISMRSGTG